MIIHFRSLMAVVIVMLSACSQLAVEVEETAVPTESAVIIVTVEVPTPLAESFRTPVRTLSSFPTATDNPVTTIMPGDPNAAPGDWASFTYYQADISFQGFVLHYPSSWTLKFVTQKKKYHEEMRLSLEKLGYKIAIGQYRTLAKSCLYPEDLDLERFFIRYGEYVEIEKEYGVVWRRARSESDPFDGMSYQVCQVVPERPYSKPNLIIGRIRIEGPINDAAILSEFDEILSRIEFLD